MKKLIESLKTAKNTLQMLWANRRTRAAIILTFYFFFFLFIIVSLRMRPDRPLSSQTKEDKSEFSFATMDNYEYDMTITYRSNTVTNTFLLSGTRYQEKHRLQTQDSLQPYYVKDDGIYTVTNGVETLTSLNYGINLYRLSPTLFSSMIEEAELQSTIEYEDGIEYLYQLPLSKFLSFYDPNNLLLSTNLTSNILFQVTEKDGMYEKINLDLTSYYQLVDSNTISYMIDITYRNIGKVKDFKIGIE